MRQLTILFLFIVRSYCLNEGLRGESVIYGVSSLVEDFANSSKCYRQLFDLYEAIDARKVWGLKVLDSSGKPSSGFLYGNNIWLGSDLQCLEIPHRTGMEVNYDRVIRPDPTPDDYPPFSLAFSVAHIKHNSTLQNHAQLPLEFIIQLGLCMPESCNTDEIMELLRMYFNGSYLELQKMYNLDLDVYEVKILNRGPATITLPKTITFLSVVCIILVLAITGTIYDVKRHNRQKILIINLNNVMNKPNSNNNNKSTSVDLVPDKSSTLGDILKCFSVYSNTKTLMSTTLPPDSVSCIHGIRLFGMLWVCLVHGVFFERDYLDNPVIGYNLAESLFAQILSNSTYCVDTFLLMSGFLTGYLFYKAPVNRIQKRPVNILTKLSNFIEMVVSRFLRLTPPYLVTLLFTNVLFTYYQQSSPLMSSERPDLTCDQYWWRNVLYINNLFPRSEMCMSWSWYLSLDMQMFIIVAFLLVLSTICIFSTTLLAVSLVIVNIVSMTYKAYTIAYIPTLDEQFRTLDDIYDLPWHRCGPYVVGFITSYILMVKWEMKLTLSRKTRIVLWCLFPMLNLWILFTLYTRQISVEFSAIYMGVARTLWGVGIAWVLVACCTGNAPALEKFLSFRGFVPLSRFTYCSYLLNPLVSHIIYLGSGTTFSASLAGFAVTVCGTTFITLVFGFILSLLVESPFILLTKLLKEKLLTNRKPRTKETA
ncbi:nose resistant to fluoxetine protein 6 [Aethina tumida]|uniref:nose resistant to fluoxetine protein 6 n=1 Tax=Aethina tumida TaxID=116153 RepID=UPI00096B3BEF|nr:nose resistant to fluoxetine protein 6 [Aethina tumida]